MYNELSIEEVVEIINYSHQAEADRKAASYITDAILDSVKDGMAEKQDVLDELNAHIDYHLDFLISQGVGGVRSANIYPQVTRLVTNLI